ncbi:MAG TPA: hypothetical protein DCL81_13590 [Algoriphagus sp.]|jgi:integrase|uniref:tyrosine-type recombinase/integrase n=1 Tax=Algoriphagus sp. TaxID=1872435 RepID=UPI000C523283|nr:tyrosine-type recombinase/integrase [Algoriphagus sp.]MAL13309.1 hypothetical protein [Algoriphagus sp.]HAH37502.1 hypothetical protein [Algoriphagus sp.]HAS57931.1 hypothetical protein [Algoriphagus sp.]HCB45357.1 hypothetical protein [Algoriphagus sp.]|tara:strand:+ start:166 stop:1377 length:1212 start_codon:yes stop_codon:yes gene_type:complete
MNVSVKLKNQKDKDGNQLLLIVITGFNKRTTISTGIKISPENWVKGNIHKRETNADLKKTLFQEKLSVLNKIITEAQIKNLSPDPAEIKAEYIFRMSKKTEEEKLSTKHSLIKIMELYREKYKNIYKASTLRSLNQVIGHIQEFDPDVYLEDIDHGWMISYCSYLVDKELQDSTIKYRHLKTLKLIAREARKEQIPVSKAIDDFRWKSPEKQPFFATWNEVQQIEHLTDFVSKSKEIVRDIFVLSCYTGLRESDLHKLNKINIHTQSGEMMMRIIVTKTDFDYSIPINNTVKKILKKYDYQIPFVTQQEFNRQIKHIARSAKIGGITNIVKTSGSKRIIEEKYRWQLFTTHTGRRTFGRRFLDMGGSLIVLSKLFGHKNIETTLHYIGYQSNEIVEEFKKVFG